MCIRDSHPRLPGHPDLVLRKYRTVIFVNGCFWHGHDGCKYFVLPKTNSEFWKDKIQKNKERDIKEQKELASMGWHCITVWECQLKPALREQTFKSLEYTLNHIYLEDRIIKSYAILEEEKQLVAESKICLLYTSFKANKISNWNFWTRYKLYLSEQKGYAPAVINQLDEITDRILDNLFNPQQVNISIDKKGLVVGLSLIHI